MLRQILWLQAANCLPKTVFFGVEFFDFLGGDRPRPLPTLQTAPEPEWMSVSLPRQFSQ